MLRALVTGSNDIITTAPGMSAEGTMHCPPTMVTDTWNLYFLIGTA